MELSEIAEKLETIGIPVAYLQFKKPQSLPFIVYYEAGAKVKGADHYNLYRDVTVVVELYAENKQPQLERQIENLFRDREIDKSPDIYIEDENMYMTTFSFNIDQFIEEE